MKLAGAYINDESYAGLVALAAANNRTLAGQCRHLFDKALRDHSSDPAQPQVTTPPKRSSRGNTRKQSPASAAVQYS